MQTMIHRLPGIEICIVCNTIIVLYSRKKYLVVGLPSIKIDILNTVFTPKTKNHILFGYIHLLFTTRKVFVLP